jgi:hypothetical protein
MLWAVRTSLATIDASITLLALGQILQLFLFNSLTAGCPSGPARRTARPRGDYRSFGRRRCRIWLFSLSLIQKRKARGSALPGRYAGRFPIEPRRLVAPLHTDLAPIAKQAYSAARWLEGLLLGLL